MTSALAAVRQMHFDSSRLLRDLDKWMDGYRSVYGSIATMDLSYDVKAGLYMAEGLLRHYVRSDAPSEVIAINIVFFDESAKLTEPLFVVAKILYSTALDSAADRNKAWDPWSAYLGWNERRTYGEVIHLNGPLKKEAVLGVAMLAMPLFSIDSEEKAQSIVEMIRGVPVPKELTIASAELVLTGPTST